MQNIKFTIAAGVTLPFDLAGRYFEIIDSQGELDLTFTDKNGSQAGQMRGVLSGTYHEEEFIRFEVTNPTTTAQAVHLLTSRTRGGTRRVAGAIKATINGTEQSLGGKHYIGWSAATGDAGANFAVLGIYSADGGPIAVRRLRVSFDNVASAQFTIGRTSNKAPLIGVGGVYNPETRELPMRNKLSGGADSARARISGFAAAVPAWAGFQYLHRPFLAQRVMNTIEFDPPLILSGNHALTVTPSSSSVGMDVSAEVEEL